MKQKNLIRKQRTDVDCGVLLRGDTGDDRIDYIIGEAITVLGAEAVDQILNEVGANEEINRDMDVAFA